MEQIEPYEHLFNIPDQHMRMVGIIACQWEWIESLLERTVAEIMEHEPARVAVLTSHIGFASKCEIIQAYARPLQKEDNQLWQQINAVIQRLHKTQRARSEFVHAKWDDNEDEPDKPIRHILSTRGKRLTVEKRPTDIKEMFDTAEEIKQSALAFAELMQGFGLLGASPQTPRGQPPHHSNS